MCAGIPLGHVNWCTAGRTVSLGQFPHHPTKDALRMKHVEAGCLPNFGILLEVFEADATVGERVVMLRLTEWDLFQRFF
jgi:hypothetical protein